MKSSDIAFTGHLFNQFIVLYLWLQAYDSTLLTITCQDIYSIKDALWIYAKVLNGEIIYIELDKSRDQDPTL